MRLGESFEYMKKRYEREADRADKYWEMCKRDREHNRELNKRIAELNAEIERLKLKSKKYHVTGIYTGTQWEVDAVDYKSTVDGAYFYDSEGNMRLDTREPVNIVIIDRIGYAKKEKAT